MVRLTDRLDTTLDVYHGSKTTIQQQQGRESEAGLCHLTTGSSLYQPNSKWVSFLLNLTGKKMAVKGEKWAPFSFAVAKTQWDS